MKIFVNGEQLPAHLVNEMEQSVDMANESYDRLAELVKVGKDLAESFKEEDDTLTQ